MKYTEEEVLDILKTISDSPKKILKLYNTNKANTPLDLNDRQFNHFVYSFPVIIDNEEKATITLVSLYGGDLHNIKDSLMQKYMGYEEYKRSYETFSHDTYQYCYLTIHKKFKLPEIAKEFHAQSFTTKDADNIEFTFKMSYGNPYTEEDKGDRLFYNWVSKSYQFDNNVKIKIENNKLINGWELGKKINENIKTRLRDNKISDIIK